MRLMSTSKNPDDYRGGAHLAGRPKPRWLRALTSVPEPRMPRSLERLCFLVVMLCYYAVIWLTDSLWTSAAASLSAAALVGATLFAWAAWQRRRGRSAGPARR